MKKKKPDLHSTYRHCQDFIIKIYFTVLFSKFMYSSVYLRYSSLSPSLWMLAEYNSNAFFLHLVLKITIFKNCAQLSSVELAIVGA